MDEEERGSGPVQDKAAWVSATETREVKSQNWWNAGRTRGAEYVRRQRGRDDKVVAYVLGNRCKVRPPCEITFIRLSSGTLDDDNLQGGFKHIRDGFCAGLMQMPLGRRVGDADAIPGLVFKYSQEKCKRGYHAFRIEVASVSNGDEV